MRVVVVVVAILASTGCDVLFRVDSVTPIDAGNGNGDGKGGSGDALSMVCLDDTFGSMTIDLATWTVAQPSSYQIGMREGGGALEVTIPSFFAGMNSLDSIRRYDMTRGYLVVELTNASLGAASVGFQATFDFNNYFQVDLTSTELNFSTVANGQQESHAVAALGTLPVYLRIHDTGAAVAYETSSDGASWTPLLTDPTALPVSNLAISIYAASYTMTSSAVSTADFANLRLVGPNCQ